MPRPLSDFPTPTAGDVAEALLVLRRQVGAPVGLTIDDKGWPMFRFAALAGPAETCGDAIAGALQTITLAAAHGFRILPPRTNILDPSLDPPSKHGAPSPF